MLLRFELLAPPSGSRSVEEMESGRRRWVVAAQEVLPDIPIKAPGGRLASFWLPERVFDEAGCRAPTPLHHAMVLSNTVKVQCILLFRFGACFLGVAMSSL